MQHSVLKNSGSGLNGCGEGMTMGTCSRADGWRRPQRDSPDGDTQSALGGPTGREPGEQTSQQDSDPNHPSPVICDACQVEYRSVPCAQCVTCPVCNMPSVPCAQHYMM